MAEDRRLRVRQAVHHAGTAISSVISDDRRRFAAVEHLFPQCTTRALAAPPASLPAGLTLEELEAALRDRGVAQAVVTNTLRVIARQRQLLNFYRTRAGGGRPNEHEVVAYLVLSLLYALGWSEEQLAPEWNKVVVAGF